MVGGVSAMFDRVILFRYKINPLSYLIFIQIFTALNCVIFFISERRLIKNLKVNIGRSWKILILISLLTVSHRYMFASAVQVAASMGLAVAVYKLSSLVHVFSGGKFFGEKDIFRRAIAGIVILGGAVLIVIK